MSPMLISRQEYVDPRVRRTRQMLEHSLESLLAQRPFEQISVGDIADFATLNRATFYAHFVDKFELLEGMVATRFQNLLLHRGVVIDGTCPSALYAITLAVCDFLANTPYCSQQRQVALHLEQAMVAILRTMLVEGLNKHPMRSDVDPEMVASAIAGAIYGSARQWIRTANRPAPEEAAAAIVKLLGPMMK